MSLLKSLSATDLKVVCRDEPEFLEAVARKSFNKRIPHDRLPDAVLRASSVSAVQSAVKFCAENDIRISVRSGGHSWYHSWLNGEGTVVLDVGDIKDVQFNPDDMTVSVGPGASGDDVTKAIPEDMFFLGGHSPQVAMGGFILGGGFGIGFTKFGLTSKNVLGVEVVLASGEIVNVNRDSTDDVSKDIMHLICGSYSGFPAVVTKYKIQLHPKPRAVLASMFIFELSNWKNAVSFARDIQHRGDEDAAAIEVVMVFCHAPPPLAEATGVRKVAMVNLIVWGDSEEESRSLLKKYTNNVSGTVVPPEEPKIVPAEAIPEMIDGPFKVENARWDAQGFLGDETIYDFTDEEVSAILEPIVDMWKSENAPPHPSHTLILPIHPSLRTRCHRGEPMATGYTPSLVVLCYAVYSDESLDEKMRETLTCAQQSIVKCAAMKTLLTEGNVSTCGASHCFNGDSYYKSVKDRINHVDPSGVFSGFHGK